MTDQQMGRCLCGGVTVTIPARVTDVGVCHCADCRTWTSGPWMALRAPPETRIEGASVKVFRSSAFAERGFCGTCGSVLFHRPQDGPEIAVSAGLFDPARFTLAREIFFDRKPAFYSFGQHTLKRSALAMAAAWGPRLLWRRMTRAARTFFAETGNA
jgi:hypothetical protein